MDLTDALREDVRKAAGEMHILFRRGYTPNVKPDKRCKNCSLENLCVPKLQKTRNVRAYIQQGMKVDD